MDRYHLFKVLVLVAFFTPVALVTSDNVSIYLDEATMSQDQAQFFYKFLVDEHLDTTNYCSRQFCKVGQDCVVFQDSVFDKFLKRAGASESDLWAFRYGCIPLQIKTSRFGDTMEMRCRSELCNEVNNLYACIDVIPGS